jgi:pyrroloquinoline quinone biosynthesis protein B
MLRVIVLGAAAGGGLPQWNCGCYVCHAARARISATPSTQASIAVSVDDEHWFLINASPDLRQQLTATPRLHPKAGQLRHSPIAGVVLTNGEVDAVAGLLSLREGWPFHLYAHERVLKILQSNSIFNVLNEKLVARLPIAIDSAFVPALTDGRSSGLEILPFAVAGKSAWYLEGQMHPAGEDSPGDTIGLRISNKRDGKHFYFIAACAAITPDLKTRLAGAPLVFFDGTLWRDDEMIELGLAKKTGKSMGHLSMSEEDGSVAGLAELGIDRKIFLHVNNSNSALMHESKERQILQGAGWEVANDGMEVLL